MRVILPLALPQGISVAWTWPRHILSVQEWMAYRMYVRIGMVCIPYFQSPVRRSVHPRSTLPSWGNDLKRCDVRFRRKK
jgi:hypothetical protein